MLTYDASKLLYAFGEDILYQEKQIRAVVTIGETDKAGNGITNSGTASFATIEVANADVPFPSMSDIFFARGQNWSFVREIANDGIMRKLLVRSNTRHK
jgi:hypothetical protein